ncbi:MAG: ATP synthase F1 subunit epsilon [Candidatus Sericytochromatia bacterium]
MTLEVLSPHGIIFSDIVESVSLRAKSGEMGILSGHIPIFAELDMGVLTYKLGNQENYIAVMGGFLEVANNKVNIITSSGEIADNIDKARALKDKEEAEKIAMKKAGDAAYLRAEREAIKAHIRLRTLDLLEKAGRKPKL